MKDLSFKLLFFLDENGVAPEPFFCLLPLALLPHYVKMPKMSLKVTTAIRRSSNSKPTV